jgi:hypothetical protein
MQGATVSGSGNVIVQIEGDGNTVLLGKPHLVLTRHTKQVQIRSDLQLLVPYNRTLPLIGRETELQELWDFLHRQQKIAVRVLTGEGGAGKTRLALTLCDEASEKGWDAGFLTSDELKRFMSQQNLTEWGWRKPTLAVVDYAASQAAELSRWLVGLAGNPGFDNRPLRLLLLERHAENDSGWWQTVFGRGSWEAINVQALLDPEQPLRLPSLGVKARAELLRAMLNKLGYGTKRNADDLEATHELRAAEWAGQPLF